MSQTALRINPNSTIVTDPVNHADRSRLLPLVVSPYDDGGWVIEEFLPETGEYMEHVKIMGKGEDEIRYGYRSIDDALRLARAKHAETGAGIEVFDDRGLKIQRFCQLPA